MHRPKKRVCLVSLPGLTQQATSATLAFLPDIMLVATISGALSATALLPELQPDLLLIDANLPDEEVEALLGWTAEHFPEIACVVITMTARQREQALAWGAQAAIQRANMAGQLPATLHQMPPTRSGGATQNTF